MHTLQEEHDNCLQKCRTNVTVNIKQGTFITKQGTFITKLGGHIKAGILEAEKEVSCIALALAEQRFEL